MNDYTVDIRGWFSRGLEALKKNWAPLVGFSAISLIILIPIILLVKYGTRFLCGLLFKEIIVGEILYRYIDYDPMPLLSLFPLLFFFLSTLPTQIVGTVLKPLFAGGITAGALMAARGTPLSFGAHFMASLRNYFRALALFILAFPFIIIFDFLFVLFIMLTRPGPLIGHLILFSVALVAFLLFSCLIFALFLFVDRRGGVFKCIGLSFKGFYRHYLMNTVMMFLTLLLSISGVIACGIGLFVTIPLAYTIWAEMYQDIYKEA